MGTNAIDSAAPRSIPNASQPLSATPGSAEAPPFPRIRVGEPTEVVVGDDSETVTFVNVGRDTTRFTRTEDGDSQCTPTSPDSFELINGDQAPVRAGRSGVATALCNAARRYGSTPQAPVAVATMARRDVIMERP